MLIPKNVSIRYIAVLGFQLQGGPVASIMGVVFPSAISRYLVSNLTRVNGTVIFGEMFPSAISRYLVSNFISMSRDGGSSPVSIRYIAVLGFQPS